MTCDTVNFRLSHDQLQHMQEDGYLILERLFDDAELQPVIEEISADLDRRCREAFAAGKLTRTYEEFDFEHRLTHVDAETQEISKSMWDMKVVLPSFFGLMTNPKLLDVAEQLCGPELIASSVYRLRPKVPSHSWSPRALASRFRLLRSVLRLRPDPDGLGSARRCHRGARLLVGDASRAQGRALFPPA